MGDDCFNCDDPAATRVTLVLKGGEILEDKPLCSACVADFREVDWLEVHDAPVFTRSSSEESDEQ